MGSCLWHSAAFNGIDDKSTKITYTSILFIHQPKWVSRVRSLRLGVMGYNREEVLFKR